MASWANIADGGTNGATVTVANSNDGTSGDAFDDVTIERTTTSAPMPTLTYSTSAARRGTLGYRFRATHTSTRVYVTTGDLGSPSYQRLRFYMRVTDYPGVAIQLATPLGPGGEMGWLQMDASGTLTLRDKAEGVIATTTNGLSKNKWYRVEVIWNPGSTTSSGTVRLAYALEDGDAIQTIVKTGRNLGTNTVVDRFKLGKVSGGVWDELQIDDIATDDASDSTFIGPASLNKVKVGSSNVSLRVGSSTPAAVYAGTTAIWP